MQPHEDSRLGRFWRAIVGWWGLLALVAALVLVAGFYLEENASGKRAWEKYKRELEAKGEVLDWLHYVPAAVSNDQNIYEAPKMQAWFVRGGSGGLTSRLSPAFSRRSQGVPRAVVIAKLTVITNSPTDGGEADLALRYRRPMLLLALDSGPSASPEPSSQLPLIPLILVSNVPLHDIIAHLATAAKLDCALDPNVLFGKGGQEPEPLVSFQSENTTAVRALTTILNNYGLLLVTNNETHSAYVIPAHPSRDRVFVEPKARESLVRSLRETVAPFSTNGNRIGLKGCQGFTIVQEPLGPITPARLLIFSQEAPDSKEISAFFPPDALAPLLPDNGRLRVERTGTNSFDVLLNSAPCYSASEYLEWSDQFEPDLGLIREALKRPVARMAGDYSQPAQIPVPDFVCVRIVAQTLSQRAQACLLLGNGDQALRELTLLHDLGRLLEAKPTTLVAAMIKVAITGLYVATVADGLRLKVWQERELAALQAQFAETDLAPPVLDAFREERASVCRTLEMTPSGELPRLWSGRSITGLRQKVTDPSFWILRNVPRGWIYQNMVVFASNEQKLLECFDSLHHTMSGQRIEAVCRETEKSLRRFAPGTFIAAMATPNFVRACQTMAITQTKVNQAQIACAIERYRLAEGHPPASLGNASPRFLDKVPDDLMTGHAFHYLLKDNDRFILYSVGWNQKDDGGFVAKMPGGRVDPAYGDWVWDSDQPGL